MKSAAAESEAECNKRKQQERERELEGDQGSPFSSCTSSQACGGGYGDYLHLQLQAQAHALGELSSKDHSLESLDSSGKPEIDPEGEPLALFYGALEPDDAYYDSLSHFSGRAGGPKKPRIQAHADYASSGCDRIAAASGAALASDPDLMLLDDSGNSISCGGGMGGMGHLTSHSADEVMFRDFPHPRHACVLFPFAPSPAVSNSACCNKCYCHACEEVAPCRLWGNGLQASDHCNATGSSWYWATRAQKSSHGFGGSDVSGQLGYGGGMAAVSPRPSSMSGLSHGLYGPSFCSLAMCGCNGGSSGEHKLLHDESPDAECLSSSCLGASSMGFIPRGDPSTDLQWFEFGSVSVPIKSRQQHRSLVDLVEALDRFSMEIFAKNCPTPECGAPDTRPEQFQYVDVLGTSSSSSSADMHHHDGRVHSYDALIDELMLNEAQGQLQVIMTVIPESSYQHTGTAHIRIFLKKERGEEIITLKELLHEIFPDNLALQEYLSQVDQMRRWVESTDDWASFAGLLKDLESNGYREADQPSGLTVPLRPYQRQSLQFMLDAEHREGGLLSVNYHRLPPCGESIPPLLYSASLGHLMDGRDDAPAIRGGFLCEEMGLGKTIEILALILANPCSIERCSAVPAFSKGTLIVCPVSIVGQWANEVKSKLAANLSIYMYHGSKRIRDPKKLAKFDIVITTYATLGSDFSKATQATRHGAGFAEQFCPLLTVNWWRVVLDESHTVKDPAPLHSRACAKLKADRRWCCTGTPINTSIYDLYGQFLFLKLEPLDNKGIFRRRIGRPYERHCKSDDQTVLLWTLNKMMIRHTKQQKFNGRELLRLPPKTEQDIPVRFTLEERTAYETVYQKVITKFEEFRCWGPTVVSKNILQIMSLLLPLRRLCSGGFVSDLELNMHHKSEPNSAGAVADFCPSTSSPSLTTETGLGDPQGECGICFELMECPTKTPCGHWFCCECVMSALGIGSEACPVCRSALTASQLVTHQPKLKDAALPLVDLASFEELAPFSSNRPEDADAIKGVQMDSKLKVLLADLAKVRQENEGAKVLIFSQFMQTIAWLKTEFKKQGVNYRFISGDMPMKKRAQAIEAFQKDPPTTVFLLSIRTGAVGITLTAASHVYMLEPCLNPALEEQAVGRCWRMGQERPVVIKRLFVEDSVEANILKLLRTRSSHASLSSSQDSDSTSRPKGTKNGAGDVAGCIRTDKQNLRLNEFEILFS